MLASENRLKGNDKIEEIKRNGKVLQGKLFGLVYQKDNNDSALRFGFIVSTKISKLAVHRNRINRSLHEGVRRILSTLPTGYNFVFLCKKSIEEKSTSEIINEVEQFFKDVVPNLT